MLPLALFRSRTFSGANLLTLFLYAALSGVLFFLPMNLVQVQGYTATQAGAALLPFILLMFLLSRWSGGLIHRFGARKPLMTGPLIAAAGLLLMARPGIGGSYWSTFFPAVCVLGLGMAVSVAPLTTAVMNSVSQDRAGVASGVNNAVSRIAGLLGIALFGIAMLHAFNFELDRRLARMELSEETRRALDAQRVKLAGAELSEEQPRLALKRAIDQSFVFGFRLIMVISLTLALASAWVAYRVIDSRGQTEHREI